MTAGRGISHQRARNDAGFSLVEVLVAAGVVSIVMLAISSMSGFQMNQTRVLADKLASLDMGRQVIATLASGAICTAELATTTFNPSGPYSIDSTNLPAQSISLAALHSGATGASAPLVTAGQAASALSGTLLVDTIQFTNFTTAGVADRYFANLTISFRGSVQPLKPFASQMIIQTNPMDPPSRKHITSCVESGGLGSAYRYMFTTTQSWTVPPGVKSALVSMAGGGGSGTGWRVVNAIYSGHSGGYVFSQPVNLIPGETVNVIVGTGGRGYPPVNTAVPADPGPPYFIFTNPPGDDGLGGYPGTPTKIVSPTLGTIIECDGGSGATWGGIDAFAGPVVAGNVSGGITGGGTPPYASPNRAATGPYAQPGGPGACGTGGYGIGNAGDPLWFTSSATSGNYPGGTTPFGYGAGGMIAVSGCYVTSSTTGTCISPANGRDGVVYIDVIQ